MGDSIQQWNAIRAARATEELVAHARAEELRRQGVLAPTDGVAELRAHDRQVKAANTTAGHGVLVLLGIFAAFALFMYFLVSCVAATF